MLQQHRSYRVPRTAVRMITHHTSLRVSYCPPYSVSCRCVVRVEDRAIGTIVDKHFSVITHLNLLGCYKLTSAACDQLSQCNNIQDLNFSGCKRIRVFHCCSRLIACICNLTVESFLSHTLALFWVCGSGASTGRRNSHNRSAVQVPALPQPILLQNQRPLLEGSWHVRV